MGNPSGRQHVKNGLIWSLIACISFISEIILIWILNYNDIPIEVSLNYIGKFIIIHRVFLTYILVAGAISTTYLSILNYNRLGSMW